MPDRAGLRLYLPAIAGMRRLPRVVENVSAAAVRGCRVPSMVILGRRRRTCRRCSTRRRCRIAARDRTAVGSRRGRPRSRASRSVADRVVVLRDAPHAPSTSPAASRGARGARAPATSRRTRELRRRQVRWRSARPACHIGVYSDPPRPSVRRGKCAAVGGVIAYRDDNHLTAAFAAARWRQFAQALDLSKNLRPI